MLSEIYIIASGIAAVIMWTVTAIKRNISYNKILLIVIFILYMTALISATLFPIMYDKNLMTSKETPEVRIKLVPFDIIVFELTNTSFYIAFVQIIGNVVMTVPFGILFPLIFQLKRKYLYMAFAILLPVSIESLQLVLDLSLGTYYRTVDVDDIILNFSGIMIGYLVCKLLPDKLKSKLTQ